MPQKCTEISGNRGAIMVMAVIVLLAVLVLGLAMVSNSMMGKTMSSNEKERVISFYAADAMMTKIAQEVMSGRGDLYTRKRRLTGTDFGSVSYSGGDSIKVDTQYVWGAGLLGTVTSDGFHFEYVKVSGDCDVSALVERVYDSIGTATSPTVGLMVREQLNAASKFVYWGVSATQSMRLSRTSAGALASSNAYPQFKAGVPLRLERSRDRFYLYVDEGLGWKLVKDAVSNADLPMAKDVFVGIAVSSGAAGALTKGKLVSVRGIPSIDTVQLGTYKVRTETTRLSDGTYAIASQAYRILGGVATFSTALNQVVSPNVKAGWRTHAEDSLWVPVTLYDFHADQSNPEFQVNGGPGFYTKGMIVNDSLAPGRRPIATYQLASTNKGYRNCLINTNRCYTADGRIGPTEWYTFAGGDIHRAGDWFVFVGGLTSKTYMDSYCGWHGDFLNNYFMNFPSNGCQAQFPSSQNWFFSDSVHLWFRPWNVPGAQFDTLTGKWSGLVYDSFLKGYVCPSRTTAVASTDTAFANIVVYDSLVFVRDSTINPKDKNTYVFGKTCDTTVHTYCGSSLAAPWGDVVPWTSLFHPLKNRGFGYDGPYDGYVSGQGHIQGYPYSTWGVFRNQNYAFTMDFHRKFIADTNQIFTFKGNDDVWAFVGDTLIMDLGGIHGATIDTIKVKSLITSGKLQQYGEYWFDFFYCERNGWGSEILISTNIMWYDAGRPSQRRWKRDYGLLD